MTRFVVLVLLTLASAGPLHAAVLMRLPSQPAGNSTLPGYAGWIPIYGFDFTIDRNPPPQSGSTEDINIGVGRINLFTVNKPTDGLSTRLIQFAINGNSLGVAEIRVVEANAQGRIVPTAAWKFDRTFVSGYSTESSGGDPIESVSLYFNKIAYGVVDNGAITVNGWNRTTNTTWTDHGLQAALQSELNAASAIPGDFTLDGRVDGADLLAWQRGVPSPPSPAANLANWRAYFGIAAIQPAAASVPEPATSMMMIAAAFTLCGLGAAKNRSTTESH